jgi:hypothetical protein
VHIEHKEARKWLKQPKGTIVYTSLRYRDDYKRRALGLLSYLGYYKKIGRFTYKRTDKIKS